HFLLFLLFAGNLVQAQKLKKEDKQLIANLQQHIRYLADDKLEGRRTGTPGEKLAADYISNEFKKIGLTPKGTNDYYQVFEIDEGRQIEPSTTLTINGKNLELNKEFFPLVFSPNVHIEALPSMALQEPGMPWFYDLRELLEENAGNPHFDLHEAIIHSAREVKKRGGTAVFIYNSSSKEDDIHFEAKDRSEILPIPVVYLTREAVKKYLSDESATIELKLRT